MSAIIYILALIYFVVFATSIRCVWRWNKYNQKKLKQLGLDWRGRPKKESES